MLTFARRQEFDREVIDVAALILGTEDLLGRTLGPQFKLRIDLGPRLPAVVTDPAQLESALTNVIINARDAMPHGGIIKLTARRERLEADANDLPAGDYLRLIVSDEGEGMDEQTLARATEPFFTTKGVGKGTGLGLAMLHGLIAQSGGALRLKSKVGVGTEVELWFPASSHGASATSARARSAPEASTRPLTILAVDDDELVLLNTVAMLEDLGHKVISANNGDEALRALANAETVDVLVTDHAMPKMTGAELARRVKRERPGMPILLATGYAELPAGECADVVRLPKPFAQRQLADAIVRVLEFDLP
jgi:CheY-like chemotaxis protein/two-component sensor histidine kinase